MVLECQFPTNRESAHWTQSFLDYSDRPMPILPFGDPIAENAARRLNYLGLNYLRGASGNPIAVTIKLYNNSL